MNALPRHAPTKRDVPDTSAKSTKTTTTKAPVSSRERGRQYRARLKMYQRELQRDVAQVRRHTHDLERLVALQRQLTKCAAVTVASAIIEHVSDVLGVTQRRDDKPLTITGALRFHVASFELTGASDALVLALHGALRGRLPQTTIHRLYQCVPGNSALLDALLDRNVAFATTRTIFFAADGAIQRQVDTSDFASTLVPFTSHARGLREMLREMEGATADRRDDACVEPVVSCR